MSKKESYRIFFADERAALYLRKQEELARRRLNRGKGDDSDLETIEYIQERLKLADELQKKMNRYRRLLAAAKESVSELLNDSEI